MKLIDTHAHIFDTAFDADRAEVITNATNAGIDKILMPAIDSGSHGELFDAARENPNHCLPMMGLHPTSVNDNPNWKEEIRIVEKLIADPPKGIPKFYAVGEIGIDLYWSTEWLANQIEAFETQIELALKLNLPIVVHTRAAWPQMIEIIAKYRGRGLKGVMHAWSGEYAHYTRIRDCGDFLFGIGGVVTYKNSGVADVMRRIPVEHIVLETDCPYLTPVPFRGKRNEPRFIIHILDKVAEIYGLLVEDIARITNLNARNMFGI